jgi:hypothetical protein
MALLLDKIMDGGGISRIYFAFSWAKLQSNFDFSVVFLRLPV